MPTLSVELNGDAVHSIRAPDRFTTNRPFSIELENLGRSTHVHLHFDDELDRVASLTTANHYVEDEATRRIHVSVNELDEPVQGKLKVVTGYGSGVEYVDVRIDPPVDRSADDVVVDESLSTPPERPPEPPVTQRLATALDRAVENGGLPALGLALLAVVVAVAVAVAVDSVIVLLGIGVVVGVAFAAALFVLW